MISHPAWCTAAGSRRILGQETVCPPSCRSAVDDMLGYATTSGCFQPLCHPPLSYHTCCSCSLTWLSSAKPRTAALNRSSPSAKLHSGDVGEVECSLHNKV
eukprot:100823-Rhodomonas_salina.1